MNISIIKFQPPEGINLILGQAHFIKTVEDLYETLISSSPTIKFGIAFCESSGKALVRHDANERELGKLASQYAYELSAGHTFIVLLKDAYPVNVLNRIKMLDEVVNIYAATANPLEVVIAETEQGRGILGVIDGVKTKGIEEELEKKERHDFLRNVGYKK
jgi:adenosine/AMP kinase